MCGLCGMLGGEVHWTDRAAPAGAAARPALAERLHRAALINRVLGHYGLAVADWQGASYLLSGRTGRTEIAADLPRLWQTAEAMLGRCCDPLEKALIARLEAAAPTDAG
jgi:hypothetical protein